MNNFKRFLALMLVLCMAVCLCACGGADNTTGTTKGTEAPTEPTNATQPSETEPTQSTSDGKVDYKITVLYPDGTPVVGCYVMICLEDLCYTPVAADENGVAVYRLVEQSGYKAKLAAKVEGYLEVDYIYFEDGVYELTITLEAEG